MLFADVMGDVRNNLALHPQLLGELLTAMETYRGLVRQHPDLHPQLLEGLLDTMERSREAILRDIDHTT